VKDILSIMFARGMHDYSGEWDIAGVPAKSGVSGGVIAVVNRQLGIATHHRDSTPVATAGGIEVQ
jgi:glutaminase